MTENKYKTVSKELQFLNYVVYAGLAASYLQLVHTFGKGDWWVGSAWLKALFIEGIIGLLTRYVARANMVKMNAGFIWVGLLIATIISIMANIRYELVETLAVKSYELGNGPISFTWVNIVNYVDVINWVEAISFSGIIPVFVLIMAFVILVAEKTQKIMIADEEKRLKINAYQNERNAKLRTVKTSPFAMTNEMEAIEIF